MATRVYGASDDLIEFEGDVRGEVGFYTATDSEDAECLLFFSDGTILGIRYGKADAGIWAIAVHRQGDLFLRVDPCFDEDNDPYSDVAHFRDGLRFAYAATRWERVK
jgi:hypothetical protein